MAYFLTIAHQQTIADSIHPEIMAAVQHAWTDAQSNDESSSMMITGWQFHNGRFKLIFPISITLKMSLKRPL